MAEYDSLDIGVAGQSLVATTFNFNLHTTYLWVRML
jgi:hypothetical protein